MAEKRKSKSKRKDNFQDEVNHHHPLSEEELWNEELKEMYKYEGKFKQQDIMT
jgi:hypothetical protein